MTPDAVTSFFDAYAVLIMFVWGFLHTRLPALAKVPNALVPWVNALGYVLARLAVPDAHADVAGVVAAVTPIALAFKGAITSAVTSVLYDKFVKHWLDRWLPPQPLMR